MRQQWIVVLVFASLISSVAQDSGWQQGIILSVKKHSDQQNTDSNMSSYDISVRAGTTIYLILYTAPRNSSMVEYRVGADILVKDKGGTLMFHDLQGKTHSVRIVRREPITERRKG
jgi:hypothetical protein